MIELPEAVTLARQAEKYFTGKTVERVLPANSPHKFAFFNGGIEEYQNRLCGKTATGAAGFGIFAELRFPGVSLAFNDGASPRVLAPGERLPGKYQLALSFTDGSALVFTVAMYGGMFLTDERFDNPYYLKSRSAVSPLSEGFNRAYFDGLKSPEDGRLSLKAYLAANQRIPGLGNGVLQDVLFTAGLSPRRKVETLTDVEWDALYAAVKGILNEMTARGGRDTERDLFGKPGGYRTLLSKNTYRAGCPRCGGEIVKETYLGGAVYVCPNCQA